MDWGDAEVILEVDHDKLTPELAREINAFWTGADARLADVDEDPVLAVIKMAGAEFLGGVLDVVRSPNTYSMQRDFDDLEGWPPNGEHGIRLVEWDGRPDLHNEELTVEEIEA